MVLLAFGEIACTLSMKQPEKQLPFVLVTKKKFTGPIVECSTVDSDRIGKGAKAANLFQFQNLPPGSAAIFVSEDWELWSQRWKRDSKLRDEIEEALRQALEACDRLQSIKLIVDGGDSLLDVALGCLEDLLEPELKTVSIDCTLLLPTDATKEQAIALARLAKGCTTVICTSSADFFDWPEEKVAEMKAASGQNFFRYESNRVEFFQDSVLWSLRKKIGGLKGNFITESPCDEVAEAIAWYENEVRTPTENRSER